MNDRPKALSDIVAQIVDEFNEMIADDTLDFDIYAASSVAGELLSQILLSAPVNQGHKLQMGLTWLEMHLERVAPGATMTSEMIEEFIHMMQDKMLDEVESEGPGGGH